MSECDVAVQIRKVAMQCDKFGYHGSAASLRELADYLAEDSLSVVNASRKG